MKNNILLVEDEENLRKNFHELLEFHDFKVDSVENGHLAIEALKTHSYDLVISDIIMPGQDGYAVLSYIRNNTTLANLPVILLTAKTKKEDVRLGMTSGADDYITKPVLIQDLLTSIASVIKKKEQREEHLNYSLEKALENERNVKFHELRTPLFGLISLLTFTEEHIENLSKHELKQFIYKAKNSAIALNKSLSKIKKYLELEKIKINQELVLNPISLLHSAIQGYGDTIDFKITGNMPSFYFDKSCINSIFEELISNCIKFHLANSEIKINLEGNTISIINKQSHIPVSTTIEIKPFSQFDRTRNEQQGLGIGLFLCESYANMNHAVLKAFVCESGYFNVILSLNRTHSKK